MNKLSNKITVEEELPPELASQSISIASMKNFGAFSGSKSYTRHFQRKK